MSPLVPQKYSERLGLLEPDQLQEVAERFELGRVTDAQPATAGLFGQIVFLSTTKGEFVMRGNPHGHVQLTKERCVARFLSEGSSLPVPWPYQICDDAELFGWTYAVMPRLSGTTASTLWDEADESGRVALASACGEALALMHEPDADFFGPYDAQLDTFVEMEDFADWALHRLNHWRNACRSVNALSTEAELYIDNLIEGCSDALDEPFTPVLVHHDFKLGNLNFEETAGGFEPSGVFDLMEAYVADGEEDLVRMLWSVGRDEERRAFVDAYVAHYPFRPGAPERLALYALSDWLVIWEYGARNGLFEDAVFMDRAVPIVNQAREMGR